MSDSKTLQTPKEAVAMQKIARLGLHLTDARLSVPELIVTGPQSHGKSSVFKDLTNLEFPVGQGKTTSFLTAVTLLYGEQESLEANIVLDPTEADGPNDNDRCLAFSERWRNASVAQLGRMVEDASSIILRDGALFSESELRLTYRSPDNLETGFTAIDLPGLIATEPGRTQVSEICTKHMSRRNVLFLNIVQASTDAETSGGEAMCKTFDPAGDRTYTFATKIDQPCNDWVAERLAAQPDSRSSVPDGPLLFVYRGRSPKETLASVSEDEMAAVREKAYTSGPWANKRDYTGIENVRSQAVRWIEHHCAAAMRDIEMHIADGIADLNDEEAALPPSAPELDDQTRALQFLRERFRAILSKLKEEVDKVDVIAVLKQYEHLRSAFAGKQAIRDCRGRILSAIHSLFETPELSKIEPLLTDNIVQDYVRYEAAVRLKLNLRPAIEVPLKDDPEMWSRLPAAITDEVIAPTILNFEHAISEKVLSNPALVKELTPGGAIVGDPVLRKRRDLKRKKQLYETADGILKKMKQS